MTQEDDEIQEEFMRIFCEFIESYVGQDTSDLIPEDDDEEGFDPWRRQPSEIDD